MNEFEKDESFYYGYETSKGVRSGVIMKDQEEQNRQVEELYRQVGEELRLTEEQYTGKNHKIKSLIKEKTDVISSETFYHVNDICVGEVESKPFSYNVPYGQEPRLNQYSTSIPQVFNNILALHNTNNFGAQPCITNNMPINKECIIEADFIDTDNRSTYIYINGVLSYYDAKSDKFYRVANMRIDIISLVIKVFNDGRRSNFYMVRVQREGMYAYQYLVEASKVKEKQWLASKTNSTATFWDSKEVKFEDYIQWILDKCEYDQRIVYAQSGWKLVSADVEKFVTSLGIIGDDITDIRSDDDYYFDIRKDMLGNINVFNDILNMANVTKSCKCSVPLIVLTHLAVLRRKFEQAGFAPKFIMALLGETNSKKTSITLALTQFLKQKNIDTNAPQVSFESTKGGIESAFVDYPDAVLIIDDYRPANDKTEEFRLREKLELITRAYGDQNAIKRMSLYSGIDVNFKPINMCLITGEIVAGGNPSSMARMINIMMDRTQCNDELLSYYQQNPWILSTHIYDFITYITNTGNELVEYIRQRFPKLRHEYKNYFSIPRNCDAFCSMLITIEIMFSYANDKGFIDNNQKLGYIDKYITVMAEVIRENDYVVNDSKPQQEVAKAIYKAISESTLEIYDLSLDVVKRNFELFNTNQSKVIGYKDDCYMFIKPEDLLDFVRQYYKKSNNFFPYNTNGKLKALLISSNLIESYPGTEKRNVARLPIGSQYDRDRYYYIKLETFMSLLEE